MVGDDGGGSEEGEDEIREVISHIGKTDRRLVRSWIAATLVISKGNWKEFGLSANTLQ